MNRPTWTKLFRLLITLVFISSMIGIGCTPTPKVILPQVGEAGVPQIQLPDRPELDSFTDQEMQAIPRSAHGKILKNQAAWWGYADQAEAAVQGFKDYLRSLFGDGKKKTSASIPK